MRYTQKYCLVAFLTPQPLHATFHMSEWPLHVTLADVFAIDSEQSQIIDTLADALQNYSALTTKATEDSQFLNTSVVLLENTPALQKLHENIIDLLEANGAMFNTPLFTRSGFILHCTVQSSGRVHIGEQVTLPQISLVDMFPNGDWQQRTVIANFPLKNTA